MIRMLTCSQSKRLDEQRVSLNSLNAFRKNLESEDQVDHASSSNGSNQQQNPQQRAANGVEGLDDDFLDNLMKCQVVFHH